MIVTNAVIDGRTVHIYDHDVVCDTLPLGSEVRYVDVCGTCNTSCGTDMDGYSVCCMDRADHLMWRNGIWQDW